MLFTKIIALFMLFGSCIGCINKNPVAFVDAGYNFPTQLSGTDSLNCFYPLKNIFSRRDSFLSVKFHYVLDAYNERNLSIRPAAIETIRFIYEPMGYPTIIIVTPGKMLVKQGYDGSIGPEYDTSRLSVLENSHLRFYKIYFPLEEIDSIKMEGTWVERQIKTHPQLKNVAYYQYLLAKAEVPVSKPLKYRTKEIFLASKDYTDLVTVINQSEFWNGKPIGDCSRGGDADGAGFILEVNTIKKYGVAIPRDCTNNYPKLIMVCQELVNIADLDKKIHLH